MLTRGLDGDSPIILQVVSQQPCQHIEEGEGASEVQGRRRESATQEEIYRSDRSGGIGSIFPLCHVRVSKALLKVVADRLRHYHKEGRVLPEKQCGFRFHRFTIGRHDVFVARMLTHL